MKTIKGKIEFVGIPIPKDASNERIYMEGTVFVDTPEKRAIICGNVSEFGDCAILCKLSEITEEQAAEFVESGRFVDSGDFGLGNCTYYRDYPNGLEDSCEFSAKESLISLLKANDCWIKEWKEEPKLWGEPRDCKYAEEKEEYNKLPDDLLLIKLT